ncbi:MAG: MarR family winged helix-turn-helix transcriptional regulator [Gemmatimonas sp.]
MTIEQILQLVQVAYPQVYLACHTRHERKRTSAHRLSARDATILAHLAQDHPTAPARLASHLGVAKSTLSAALKHLQTFGFVAAIPRAAASGRRGGTGLVLTAKGLGALQETSVLEAPRLYAVLATLSASELGAVERGMRALGNGCQRVGGGRVGGGRVGGGRVGDGRRASGAGESAS